MSGGPEPSIPTPTLVPGNAGSARPKAATIHRRSTRRCEFVERQRRPAGYRKITPELIKRPGVERREARQLDADGVATVLKAAKASRYHAALVLIASTGLRKGEALALRWDRVDLDAGTLRVTATVGRVNHALTITGPKTARSRRTVPLSPGVVAMLRTAPPRRPTGSARETIGVIRVWCSPPSSAARSTRETCCA
jgi:integrase